MILPNTSLAISAALVATTWPSNIFVGAEDTGLLTPTFEVDFADASSVASNVQEITADILTGPGGIDALRIDECGKHAILPVNINPSVMPAVTMVLGIRLESIVEGSLGWPLSSDDGGYDRAITMHDYRFYGMGMPSGDYIPVWNDEDEGEPPLNEWLHIVAIFSQNEDPGFGDFFVNGVSASLEIPVDNGEGRTDLVVGTSLHDECTHWADSWIKEVKIFDSALTSADVSILYEDFVKEIGGASLVGESNDESEESSSSDDSEESSSSDDSNFLEDLVDAVMGSSAHAINMTKGMTMVLLIGTLFSF